MTGQRSLEREADDESKMLVCQIQALSSVPLRLSESCSSEFVYIVPTRLPVTYRECMAVFRRGHYLGLVSSRCSDKG